MRDRAADAAGEGALGVVGEVELGGVVSVRHWRWAAREQGDAVFAKSVTPAPGIGSYGMG